MSHKFAVPQVDQLVALTIECTMGYYLQVGAKTHHTTTSRDLAVYLPEAITPQALKPGKKLVVEYLKQNIVQLGTFRIQDLDLLSDATGERDMLLRLGEPISPIEQVDREFFRIYTRLDIRYLPVMIPVRYLDGFALRNSSQKQWAAQCDAEGQRVQSRDISGGGIALLLDQPMKEGQELYLEIGLPRNTLRIAGRVVGDQPVQDGTLKQYIVRVKFVGISETDRCKIVNFIFRRQLQERNRVLDTSDFS